MLSNLFTGAGTVANLISAPGISPAASRRAAAQHHRRGRHADTAHVGADGRVTEGTLTASSASTITDGNGDTVSVGISTGIVFTVGSGTSTVSGNWTATGLMVGSSKPAVNKLDVYGAQAIGTGYAGVNTAPTNGLIVQGNVGIGTTNPLGYALNVNGTINATNFSGNGSGLDGPFECRYRQRRTSRLLPKQRHHGGGHEHDEYRWRQCGDRIYKSGNAFGCGHLKRHDEYARQFQC